MKCIYCLKDDSEVTFDKTEHVIPQSFGRFTNNLTLNHVVCDDCNKYFGDQLELFLARDTFEGILRTVYKVKVSKNYNFPNKRIIIRLKEKGEWENVIMQIDFSKIDDKEFIKPIAQVGFIKKDTQKYEYFRLGNVPSKQKLEESGFIMKGKKIFKFLCNETEIELLVKEMKEKGLNLTMDKSQFIPFGYEGKRVQVELEVVIDGIICRGMGKIAFNYLAYCQGRDFALYDDFNDIRNYIRYGKKSENAFVIIQKEPILKEETRYGIKITNGHLVTLGWDGYRLGIISMVALFNRVHYRAILCKRYSGIYSYFAFGHHFDIDKMKAKELLSLPSNFFLT